MWRPAPQSDAMTSWSGFGRRDSYPDPASVYAACEAGRHRARRMRRGCKHRHAKMEFGGSQSRASKFSQPRRLRAITVPLGGGPLERTDDEEVFVLSPKSAKVKRQRSARPHRSASLPCCLMNTLDAPKCPVDSQDPEHSFAIWHDGVMRRASELTMLAQLRLMARKQGLRASGRRQQVNAAGADFTYLYGRTVEILKLHLVLQPPRRRHSSYDVCGFVLTGLACNGIDARSEEEGVAATQNDAENLQSPRKMHKVW